MFIIYLPGVCVKAICIFMGNGFSLPDSTAIYGISYHLPIINTRFIRDNKFLCKLKKDSKTYERTT